MTWTSPCRKGRGARRHHCSWWHSELVTGYRLARKAQDDRAEAYAIGYATELADFYRDVERPVTFRDWLVWSAGEARAAAAEAA